jgi:hypothetical protein
MGIETSSGLLEIEWKKEEGPRKGPPFVPSSCVSRYR